MRLWTLHPRYLDAAGLVALWREALLARKVLRGNTIGYRHHPQLQRFRNSGRPVASINAYLRAIYVEAMRRGYRFDASRIRGPRARTKIPVTAGQVAAEWQHLLAKLRRRSPRLFEQLEPMGRPRLHPLFRSRSGPVESWERARPDNAPP
ncbi:MAG TPA: pyrimidine dimer DNA glycosylase/endonuclease V [Gemmatimonadales bacterium]|jgi:hypothetical protein